MLTLLLFLSLVAFYAVYRLILEPRLQKAAERRRFYLNRCNGITAVVTEEDWDWTRKPARFPLYTAENTLIFFGDERAQTFPLPQRMRTGNMDDLARLIWNLPLEEKPSLLVPGVSEKFLTFQEQERIFKPFSFHEAYEYVHGVREDGSSPMHKKLWAKAAGGYAKYGIKVRSVMLASIIFLGVLLSPWKTVKTFSERAHYDTVYVTTLETVDGVTVAKTSMTSWKNAPVFYDYPDFLLYRCVVNDDPVPLGSDLVRVPCQRHRARLASASLKLKKGDTVYIRFARVLADRHKPNPHYEDEDWIITEEEAGALVATGRFKLE